MHLLIENGLVASCFSSLYSVGYRIIDAKMFSSLRSEEYMYDTTQASSTVYSLRVVYVYCMKTDLEKSSNVSKK